MKIIKKCFLPFLIIIIFLSILVLILPKSKDMGLKNTEYDFGIIAYDKRISFKISGDKLEKDKETKPFSKNYTLQKNPFLKIKDSYYTKTSDRAKEGAELAKVENSLAVNITKPKDFSINTYTSDNKYFYYTTHDKIVKLDDNLKEIKSSDYKNNLYSNQMVASNDSLYILDNHIIYKYSKALDFIEEIHPSSFDKAASYTNMAYSKGKLYISQNLKGKSSNGQYEESNTIIVYDIETKEENIIELDYPYPMQIYADEVNDNLIIQHYELYVPEDVWTVYSLKDGSQHQIELGKYRLADEELSAPFFTQKDGFYYFLMSDSILEVSGKDMKEKSYSFKDFDISYPNVLLIGK
ncbi:hypothetical protein BG262_06010 [Floricoccus penangensis]|uniref:DUF5050 domain-containing protein n=2 Tax=Floricoccus penangensis TaxID=1859475 RepID=A0A9Q5JFS4_9LACT|nr:hypothetical protein BG262_06010 [Floricoccus penangensis]